MAHSCEHDCAVVIGRFMGIHHQHLELFRMALSLAPRVAVVLGSAFHARSPKNPLTASERAEMITACLPKEDRSRVDFIPVRDYYDDARWRDKVRMEVDQRFPAGARIALVGHFKDASSEYLNLFSPWHLVKMESSSPMSATAVRRVLFETDSIDVAISVLKDQVPQPVLQYLKGWSMLPWFDSLVEEHRKIEEERKKYPHQPYVTADSVVRAAGHVLLVQRKNHPGKGLWAIPGGFLEPERRERLYQCALRELIEETQLGVLKSTLAESLVSTAVFDHPGRSVRGIVITHAHFFDLKADRLPEIEGGDDAARAEWVPIEKLSSMEEEFFEDHFHILSHFLGLERH